MKRKQAITWIIVFMVLVSVLPISFIVTQDCVNKIDYGKRNAAYTYFYQGKYFNTRNGGKEAPVSIPILSMKNWKDYPSVYEDYFNAILPYKRLMIRLNSTLHYYLFNETTNEQVIIGQDNWLFYREAVDSSCREGIFTDEKLAMIAQNLHNTETFLQSHGIEFVLFIAPNKETIYSYMLPDFYTKEVKLQQ